MLKKVGMTVLGMVLVLGWWTLTGKHESVKSAPEKMPLKFLAGGGGTLVIEADSTAPATLRYTLHGPLSDGHAKDQVEGYEKVAAGHSSWVTEIAPNTGVSLELEATNPAPGAKLTWTVKLNGKEIDSQSEALQGELKANEAFFIQYNQDNLSKPEEGE